MRTRAIERNPDKKDKIETKTLVMSFDNLEAAISQFLFSIGTVPKSWDIVGVSLPRVKDEDHVQFEIDFIRDKESKDLEGKQLALDIFDEIKI